MRNYGERKCIWCGKLFVAHSAKAQSCGDNHYRPCATCGEPLLVKESYANYLKYGPRNCPDCRKLAISVGHRNRSDADKQLAQLRRESTNLERYGVANPLQRDDIKEKVHQTVKEKYGVDNLSQSSEIQTKIKENSIAKYGVSHYSNDPTIRQHMIDGMQSKYNVSYALKSDELMQKLKATNLARYGVENVLANKNIQAKIKSTCLEKYGVEYAGQATELIRRRTITNQKRYGGPAYIFSPEYLKTTVTDSTKFEEFELFKQAPRNYIENHYTRMPTYLELSQDLGVCDTTISYYVCKYELKDIVQVNSAFSQMENEVLDILYEHLDKSEIVCHTRKIIPPNEIDIYIPKLKLGFECNPSCTHNSDIGFICSDNKLHYKYHKNKTDACEAVGVRLFHIFGYDWINNRDVIVSMIHNAIGVTSNRVYGRNTVIQEVDFKVASQFLVDNHRQGYTMSKVRLGLYCADELVMLMTFGKIRLGQGKIANEDTWELVRCCAAKDIVVIGGASKLFKYFCDTYHPNKVVSFSDRATTSGKLYELLHFDKMSVSDPGYVWVNLETEKYCKRVNCQKKNLPALFKEPELDIESKTEVDIMCEHGYGRVFDSGVIRWEYTPNSLV